MWVCKSCGFNNSNNDESCKNCGQNRNAAEKTQKGRLPVRMVIILSIALVVVGGIFWLLQRGNHDTKALNQTQKAISSVEVVTPTPLRPSAPTEKPAADAKETEREELTVLTGTRSGSADGFRRVPFSDATASSYFTETSGFKYPATNVIRDDISWPWVEGARGDGTGETLILYFAKQEQIDLLGVHPGFSTVYQRNNRPRLLQFEFSDGSSIQWEFEDYNQMQYIKLSHPVTTSYVRITILSVYPSNMDNDTCITTVKAYSQAPYSGSNNTNGTTANANSPVPYTEEEIRLLTSRLERAPTSSEYLATPSLGRIDNNGKAVYSYSRPTAGSAGILTIPDKEEVTIVAYYQANNRYCVIVHSKNQACWVNAARVSMDSE